MEAYRVSRLRAPRGAWLLLFVAILGAPWLGAAPARADWVAAADRPPEVRVKFRPGQEGVASAALERWAAQGDQLTPLPGVPVPGQEPYLAPVHEMPQIGWHVYRLPAGERADLAAARIRTLPGVLHAEPVQRIRLLIGAPNDPAFSEFEKGDAVFPGGGLEDKDTWLMQWNLQYIKALEGWSVWPNKYFTAQERVALPASAKPIVAIIDSGIDFTHPDFANVGDLSTNVDQGGQINGALSKNLIDGGAHASDGPKDDIGHGTHVAGIVAAAGNNGRYPGKSDRGFGVIGVGFNAQIAALKVVDGSGNGSDTDVLDAILFAADNGAMVISMSLALDGGYSQALQDAVNYAWAKGCVIVAAAGNDGVDYVHRYPAACDKVIGVGATSGEHGIWKEQRAQYSNSGLPLAVAAPGGDLIIDIVNVDLGFFSTPVPASLFMWIWSTAPTYDNPLNGIPINGHEFQYYGYEQGTSMAAPHVAGLAALYAGYRGITPQTPAGNLKIEQAIERGADNLSGVANGGWQITYGFGRINVGNTMKEVNGRNTAMGTVTGQVYYNTTPVPNANVTATPVGGTRRFAAGSQIDGAYRLVNLPAGDYDVRASFFGQVKTRRVTVVAGANTSGATFYLGEVTSDATPPGKPFLTLGVVTQGTPPAIPASWWSSDTETGIDHYEYAIGSTPGGAEVVNWTSTNHYELTIPLPNGIAAGTYFLTVRAVNGEGMVGEAAISPPIPIGG